MGLNEDRCTAALLLQLDPDALEIARYLGITPATGYKEAVGKLKDHYALTETPEELREKFTQKVKESNESLEDFAGEVRVLASRAFKGIENTILETLMLKQIVDGLRNSNTRERLIVKRPATLTEAVHFARLSEMATRVARGNKTGAPVAAVTATKFQKLANEYQQQQYQGKQFNQATGFGEYNSFKGGYQSPQAGTGYNKNFGPKQQGQQNFQRFPQGNLGVTHCHPDLPISINSKARSSLPASASSAEGLGTRQNSASHKVVCMLLPPPRARKSAKTITMMGRPSGRESAKTTTGKIMPWL